MRTLEHIESRIIPEPNSGCWLWVGVTNQYGYGRLSEGHSKKLSAHRVAYELIKGPIPDGMVLDHLCRVPCCVNPDHLEPVTHAENCRRGNAGPVAAARQMAITHCPQGHEYSVDNTYVNKRGARQCKTCMRARTKGWQRKHNAAYLRQWRANKRAALKDKSQ